MTIFPLYNCPNKRLWRLKLISIYDLNKFWLHSCSNTHVGVTNSSKSNQRIRKQQHTRYLEQVKSEWKSIQYERKINWCLNAMWISHQTNISFYSYCLRPAQLILITAEPLLRMWRRMYQIRNFTDIDIRKKRNSRHTSEKNNTKELFLRALLQLSGDVEPNPGPVTCPTCQQPFQWPWRLENHIRNASSGTCDIFDRVFCHRSGMEQHKLWDHAGAGVEVETSNNEINMDTSIFPATGHIQTTEYQATIQEH